MFSPVLGVREMVSIITLSRVIIRRQILAVKAQRRAYSQQTAEAAFITKYKDVLSFGPNPNKAKLKDNSVIEEK